MRDDLDNDLALLADLDSLAFGTLEDLDDVLGVVTHEQDVTPPALPGIHNLLPLLLVNHNKRLLIINVDLGFLGDELHD